MSEAADNARRNPWLKAVEVNRKGKAVTVECASPQAARRLFDAVVDLTEDAQEALAWETQR